MSLPRLPHPPTWTLKFTTTINRYLDICQLFNDFITADAPTRQARQQYIPALKISIPSRVPQSQLATEQQEFDFVFYDTEHNARRFFDHFWNTYHISFTINGTPYHPL
jgi:hypothetical protein